MKLTTALFVASICATGCSTIATIAGGATGNFSCDPEYYIIPRVYSGVSNDIRILRGDYAGRGVVLLDLPFSTVADTVALPYTVVTQISKGNLCNHRDQSMTRD